MEETLGKRIAKNRKRLGMTQDRLAELLGVTAQAVSKWENDQSCPDIGTLPRLAEIFGISTDELLGRERPVETTVEPSEPPRKKEDNLVEISWNSGKRGTLGLALWLLLLGAVSLFDSMRGRNVSFWTMAWSSGLLVYGLFGLWPGISVFRLGCAAVGGYFLLAELIGIPSLGWPVVLILLGILLLLRAMQKGKHTVCIPRVKLNGKCSSNFRMEGEHFESEAHFGERRSLVTLPRLSSGRAEASFGELTVDLSGCGELADGACLEVSCAFGELNLLVPRRWKAVSTVSAAFGDCETLGAPAPEAEGVLRIEGNVNFGHAVIRYI